MRPHGWRSGQRMRYRRVVVRQAHAHGRNLQIPQSTRPMHTARRSKAAHEEPYLLGAPGSQRWRAEWIRGAEGVLRMLHVLHIWQAPLRHAARGGVVRDVVLCGGAHYGRRLEPADTTPEYAFGLRPDGEMSQVEHELGQTTSWWGDCGNESRRLRDAVVVVT